MTDICNRAFEQTITQLELKVNSTLKTASTVVNTLKSASTAAKMGNLRDLTKLLETTEQLIAALQQQYSDVSDDWKINWQEYTLGSEYTAELISAAKSQGVEIYEQDGLLFCYPFLLRVLPSELSVQIDKKKDKRLRPSALAEYLKIIQNKPVRFKQDAFLECLYAAYLKLATKPQEVISLLDIYKLLTLLPGQTKEYTYQEFARDIYLLDRSGKNKTKDGMSLRLPASTGTKTSKSTMRVITSEGHEVKYYGISFRTELET
jgi:hypothetical protein